MGTRGRLLEGSHVSPCLIVVQGHAIVATIAQSLLSPSAAAAIGAQLVRMVV